MLIQQGLDCRSRVMMQAIAVLARRLKLRQLATLGAVVFQWYLPRMVSRMILPQWKAFLGFSAAYVTGVLV